MMYVEQYLILSIQIIDFILLTLLKYQEHLKNNKKYKKSFNTLKKNHYFLATLMTQSNKKRNYIKITKLQETLKIKQLK